MSRETADLIADAVALSRTTGGAFDPTVAPLVTLWGITTDSPQVPQQEQIDALLPLVGVDHVTADGTHITLDPAAPWTWAASPRATLLTGWRIFSPNTG